jgi:malonyl-CoA decarboxylase
VIHERETDQLRLRNFVTLSPIPGFRWWLQKHQPSLAGGASMTVSQPEPLLRACARYLTAALPSGRAADPVTHFHLSNGASIERINWMADKSQKGMRQSFGLMVNYSYKPARIERNHEQYVKQSRFAMSDEVAWLLKEKAPSGRTHSADTGEQPAAQPQ